jgi:DNA-binding transcriptional regulator GbsR (MarR family)
MDGELLTQEQLMELTGYSRSMVSETLAELTDMNSQYPVSELRIPGKKKKFYKSTISFVQYIRILAISNIQASETSYDFIDKILPRLEALISHSSGDVKKDIIHVKDLFLFLKSTNNSVQAIMSFLDDHLNSILETGKMPDISPYLDKAVDTREMNSPMTTEIPEDDSLELVKQDFIRDLLGVLPPVGKQRDMVAIYFTLFLGRNPVTQEYIQEFLKEVTGSSRSVISETLTMLTNMRSIQVTKKPGDRKKYYSPLMNISDYSLSRYNNQKRIFSQIKTAIKSELLPALEQVKGNGKEKRKIKLFFNENLRCYQILEDFIELMFNTFKEYHS